ncbi:uncharacterized protein E0L32_004058 [Thyridium curvatum]|uniref:ZN622/Rei1/Reh1 zinc finger C2H2-type domain-containing protein n=1 Tax=Thyridium curvatum TaxID=1093900 RepID=A0A507BGG0_9PEZI|nr:uncharacterized protein E0L32_004058 [Thyridium curvatum]TPX16409.1 hypothetical protein E0L32_004058 [Thyridium curvatum]
MSLPSNIERSSTPTSSRSHDSNSDFDSFESPDTAMPPFVPGQCLFCPATSPSFAESATHMQKSHGLFVPSQERLAVEPETLFKYLHLVIFGYRECICCGTQRATVQAVQQHMTGKGHCRFDIAAEDSEYAEFYDFSEPEGDEEDEDEDEKGSDAEDGEEKRRKPQQVDQDSIRLPSGKIISRQPSAQAAPSQTRERRRAARNAAAAAQIEYQGEPDAAKDASDKEGSDSDVLPQTQVLSRKEKRERAVVSRQLANMRAHDRSSLMHLPTSQQLSILATQHRHMIKVQKEERRRQAKIDRKGNKNLYAYWNTETPVYQCG